MKNDIVLRGKDVLARWGINEGTLKGFVKDYGLPMYDENLNVLPLGPGKAFLWKEPFMRTSFNGERYYAGTNPRSINILAVFFKISDVEAFERDQKIERKDLKDNSVDKEECIRLAKVLKAKRLDLTLHELAEICFLTQFGQNYSVETIEKKWLTGKIEGMKRGRTKKGN